MNALFQAGLQVQSFMKSKSWRFCFIGGIAVIRWGQPRMTVDIDLSLFVGFGGERKYAPPLLEQFNARIPEALAFALENRVVLIQMPSGVPVDISLAALPFEEMAVDRATAFEFSPGCSLLTCSAEDLIVYKAFASRPKDWMDVDGIIARQRGRLDQKYILQNLEPLAAAKEDPEIIRRVRTLLQANR